MFLNLLRVQIVFSLKGSLKTKWCIKLICWKEYYGQRYQKFLINLWKRLVYICFEWTVIYNTSKFSESVISGMALPETKLLTKKMERLLSFIMFIQSLVCYKIPRVSDSLKIFCNGAIINSSRDVIIFTSNTSELQYLSFERFKRFFDFIFYQSSFF